MVVLLISMAFLLKNRETCFLHLLHRKGILVPFLPLPLLLLISWVHPIFLTPLTLYVFYLVNFGLDRNLICLYEFVIILN